MIEFALVSHLLSLPVVTAIVGTRVFTERAPQTAPKLDARIVCLLLPTGERNYHSQGPSGFLESNIELTIVAPTYLAARNLYEVLRAAIDGYRGLWATTTINRASLSTPYSMSADPTQGDDIGVPAVRAMVNVFHYETVP